ncbi:hypothetical protein J2S03_000059 [Alicyclobacillus cycloheptanicus]|uniref:Uncharacterized protein n=1 Tax=Alicyclobacillus cycloheptanicus TaxID=1457 RepID=A0ABT9XDP0_9BACL|nr:hypothetical protein [Alicyclobacillus cycloheptanicus]
MENRPDAFLHQLTVLAVCGYALALVRSGYFGGGIWQQVMDWLGA